MIHYILVVKDAFRDHVMDSCLLASHYEQAGSEVHCWYETKRHAKEDAKAYAEANPGADCSLYRLSRGGVMITDR